MNVAVFRILAIFLVVILNNHAILSKRTQIGVEEPTDYEDIEKAFETYDKSPKKSLPFDPVAVTNTAVGYLNILANGTVMGSLETVLRESYKFIRLADDLHEIKSYLNDIRLCFIALTISGYVGILLYALIVCVAKRRRDNAFRRPASRFDEEAGWRSEEACRSSPQSRTPDPYRYARSGRNFQPNLQTTKLDSVDHPSKHQLVVENHTGASAPTTGLYRENGGTTNDRISPT